MLRFIEKLYCETILLGSLVNAMLWYVEKLTLDDIIAKYISYILFYLGSLFCYNYML
jgi:hypothetical protein